MTCDERADCNPFGSFGPFGSFSFGPTRDAAALDARTPKVQLPTPKAPFPILLGVGDWELGIWVLNAWLFSRSGEYLPPYINPVTLEIPILQAQKVQHVQRVQRVRGARTV